MVEEALAYHLVTIKLFFALLVINLWVPWISRHDMVKEIKRTRITFFLFSAMVTMVAFTGAVLVLIAELPWSMGMTLMVLAWLLLSAVEIARSMKLTKLWREGKNVVSVSWHYVVAEIGITLAMILFAVFDHKDAVPLP